MDFDSIPYGVDFREHIRQTLEQVNALVVIIGPHWSESREGVRRIDESNDFVRFEVKAALERGIAVIPVLVNNATMPTSEQLPGDIEGLAFRNALVLDAGVDFHHHTDRLISALDGLIGPASCGQRSRNSSSRGAAAGDTGAKVIGDSWKGVGSFDGEQGYYDWEFHDGSGRTGSTKIRLDREGYLYGTVSGSGINWSYWASRQPENL